MFEQAEMYEQTEAFPKTRREFAEEFLSHFQADVEAAEKSLVNAQVKLAAARRIRDDGEENLRLAIRAEEGIDPAVEGDATDETEDADFEPIAEIEGDVLDPITGEVVSKAEAGDEVMVTPHVLVIDPEAVDDSGPHKVLVGEHTTYGELVADYTAENLIDLDVEDFMVAAADGSPRDINAVITSSDYGQTFRVELRPSEAELAEHEALRAQEPAA